MEAGVQGTFLPRHRAVRHRQRRRPPAGLKERPSMTAQAAEIERPQAMAPEATGAAARVLTPEALDLLTSLHRRFNRRRLQLLDARLERQARFDAGERPDFPAETADIRSGDWTVDPIPPDLLDRRVEITGPVDRK